MSGAGASRRWAAICNAFDLTPAAAWRRAPPPAIIARLANVPVPTGTEAVSTGTTSTSSGERPSVSPTNWAKTVSCPCPWEGVETYARTPPEPSTLTAALSSPRTSRMPRRRNVPEPIPVYSTKAVRPAPTVRPAAGSQPAASVCSDLGLVRCHGHGRIGIRREAVRHRHDLRRAHRLEYRGQGVDRIGTAVAGNVGPQGQQASVAIHRNLGLDHLLPGLRHGQEVLPPVLDPLCGAPQPAGHGAGYQILR